MGLHVRFASINNAAQTPNFPSVCNFICQHLPCACPCACSIFTVFNSYFLKIEHARDGWKVTVLEVFFQET